MSFLEKMLHYRKSMLSFFDMNTLKQLISGNYPRNSRFARWDRRVLMGIINLTLIASMAGAAIDTLGVHFTWQLNAKAIPVKMRVSREHWGYVVLNPDILDPSLRDRLPSGLEPWSLSAATKIAPSGFQAQLLTLLASVPMDLIVIAIILLVRQIVVTTIGTDNSEGNPFIQPNVRRLRIIAVILLATPLIQSWMKIAETELTFQSLSNIPPETTMLTYDLSSPFIFFGMGFMVLVLAAVFKAGVQLREDVEGLV
jgi:hypothetical protein